MRKRAADQKKVVENRKRLTLAAAQQEEVASEKAADKREKILEAFYFLLSQEWMGLSSKFLSQRLQNGCGLLCIGTRLSMKQISLLGFRPSKAWLSDCPSDIRPSC